MHFGHVFSALDIRTENIRKSARELAISEVVTPFLLDGDLREMAQLFASRVTRELRTADPSEPECTEEEVLAFLKASVAPTEVESEINGQQEGEALSELLEEEWEVLTRSSPGSDREGAIHVVEECLSDEDPYSSLSGFIDGIFLVERLREVRALKGFRRVTGSGKLYYPNLDRKPPTWLPATEVFGEGFFIRFNQDRISQWEESNSAALARRVPDLSTECNDDDFVGKRFEQWQYVAGRMILVHTVSHLLIRQLCYECGYHAASLRERLYVFSDKAGVLIYTADGDSEGSLGGLVRQGRQARFYSTLMAALRRAEWCSNDPICLEMPQHGPKRTNLAACHACAMVAETSCTELNGLLDRGLVIGDQGQSGAPGAEVIGFFRDLLDSHFTT